MAQHELLPFNRDNCIISEWVLNISLATGGLRLGRGRNGRNMWHWATVGVNLGSSRPHVLHWRNTRRRSPGRFTETFRDAVGFCRGLKLDISGLMLSCTIRDDRPKAHDWEQQSVEMGVIRQNSFIITAAVAAAGNRDGNFFTKPLLKFEGFKLPSESVWALPKIRTIFRIILGSLTFEIMTSTRHYVWFEIWRS